MYYNPSDPRSLGCIKRLEERYMKKERHKPVRKSFPRRRVLVNGIDDQWQIDLVDLSSLSRVNGITNFFLRVSTFSQSNHW